MNTTQFDGWEGDLNPIRRKKGYRCGICSHGGIRKYILCMFFNFSYLVVCEELSEDIEFEMMSWIDMGS